METANEFTLKKREMFFRNRVWFAFAGNLYRNASEIPIIMEAFPVKHADLLLEVGAGSGRFTKVFTDAGAQVVAVDISRISLQTNRKRTMCHTVLADLCFLPFRDSVFDKGAALNVFQYVPSKRSRLQGLSEARRTVKKDALFAIEVYNYRIWDRLQGNGKEGFHTRVDPPIYYYRCHKDEVKRTLTSVFSKVTAVRPTLIFHSLIQLTGMGEIPTLVKGLQFFERALTRSSLRELAYAISCCIACVCQK